MSVTDATLGLAARIPTGFEILTQPSCTRARIEGVFYFKCG